MHKLLIDARQNAIGLAHDLVELSKLDPADEKLQGFADRMLRPLSIVALMLEEKLKALSPKAITKEENPMKSGATIESLIALADRLDLAGEETEASKIDEMIESMASHSVLKPEEERKIMKEDEKVNKKLEQMPKEDEKPVVKEEIKHHVKASIPAAALEKLATIADKLDEIGATDEAGMIDDFLADGKRQNTEYLLKGIEDEITEMLHTFLHTPTDEAQISLSKKLEEYVALSRDAKPLDKNAAEKKVDVYDSKAHHDQQVRKQTPRNEVKEHHVAPYQETKSHALSTRYCPNHIGVSLSRICEGLFQCSIDGEIFNWETGWNENGKAVPGGSVSSQTPNSSEYSVPNRIFDSREKALQGGTY